MPEVQGLVHARGTAHDSGYHWSLSIVTEASTFAWVPPTSESRGNAAAEE
jgi:hypothetical protein